MANPPYVAEAEFSGLARGVRDFEPREAFVSPDVGLHHVQRLLEEARDHLTLGGVLAVEVDARRAASVLERARTAGWRNAAVHRDLFGRDRYLFATKE
ncbi:MAG: hypothetical protein IH616_02430 [Gemmatimonadales bacterium]|nr:hypothetical protein [Gemmatimonadales bacterium]